MSLIRRVERGHKSRLLRRLLEKLTQPGDLKLKVDELLEATLAEENIILPEEERRRLHEQTVAYLLGAESTTQSQTSPAQPTASSAMNELKSGIASKLLSEAETWDIRRRDEVYQHIEDIFNEAIAEGNIVLPRAERHRLFEAIVADTLGFGPLETLLADDTVTEILVLGPKNIFMTRKAHRERADITFDNEEHLLRILDRMLAPLGKRIDEIEPMISLRMPDGSRIAAIVRPPALNGPTLTIHKVRRLHLTAQDLIRLGTLPQEALEFLHACVLARLNIVISGGDSVGKSTLLNVLCHRLEEHSLIVTVEDTPELQLMQSEVAVLQTRPSHIEGKTEITLAQLVRHALRMHPEHLIVGEMRGEEAYDLVHAHVQWMTTLNSRSVDETLMLSEIMCRMNRLQMPPSTLRSHVARGVHIIVHLERLPDASRKVTNIIEVQGVENEGYILNELFAFEYRQEEALHVTGILKRTAVQPSKALLTRLRGFPVDKATQAQIKHLFP